MISTQWQFLPRDSRGRQIEISLGGEEGHQRENGKDFSCENKHSVGNRFWKVTVNMII